MLAGPQTDSRTGRKHERDDRRAGNRAAIFRLAELRRYQRWLDSTKNDGPVRLVPFDVVGSGRFISIGLQKRGTEPPQIIELPASGAPTRS